MSENFFALARFAKNERHVGAWNLVYFWCVFFFFSVVKNMPSDILDAVNYCDIFSFSKKVMLKWILFQYLGACHYGLCFLAVLGRRLQTAIIASNSVLTMVCPSHLQTPFAVHEYASTLCIVRRNRCCSMSDSAYSYTFLRNAVCLRLSVVCHPSVCHIHAPCLNRSTDLDPVWQVHLWGPMTHCVIWGSLTHQEKG